MSNKENTALMKGTNMQFNKSDQTDKYPNEYNNTGAVAICAATVVDKKPITACRIFPCTVIAGFFSCSSMDFFAHFSFTKSQTEFPHFSSGFCNNSIPMYAMNDN